MAAWVTVAAAMLLSAAREPAASAGCGVRDREPVGDDLSVAPGEGKGEAAVA